MQLKLTRTSACDRGQSQDSGQGRGPSIPSLLEGWVELGGRARVKGQGINEEKKRKKKGRQMELEAHKLQNGWI